LPGLEEKVGAVRWPALVLEENENSMTLRETFARALSRARVSHVPETKASQTAQLIRFNSGGRMPEGKML
jgi:hypothetical protein